MSAGPVLVVEKVPNGEGGMVIRVVHIDGELTPSQWGIILCDIARSVANGRAPGDPRGQAETLVEIRKFFQREWDDPTDWVHPESSNES